LVKLGWTSASNSASDFGRASAAHALTTSADDSFCDVATAALGAIEGEVRHDEIASALADLLRDPYPPLKSTRRSR
jgi:hypothetical protein